MRGGIAPPKSQHRQITHSGRDDQSSPDVPEQILAR
jgi:hypothetical protein